MHDERLEIRVSAEFLEKIDYLMKINGFKSRAETIRRIIEKEYIKETNPIPICSWKGMERNMLDNGNNYAWGGSVHKENT